MPSNGKPKAPEDPWTPLTPSTISTYDLTTLRSKLTEANSLIAQLTTALTDARKKAAYYTFQHKLLTIEAGEAMQRHQVENDMAKREVEVLRKVDPRHPHATPTALTFSSGIPAHEQDIRNPTTAINLYRKKLNRAKLALRDNRDEITELRAENERLKKRIRENRAHRNSRYSHLDGDDRGVGGRLQGIMSSPGAGYRFCEGGNYNGLPHYAREGVYHRQRQHQRPLPSTPHTPRNTGRTPSTTHTPFTHTRIHTNGVEGGDSPIIPTTPSYSLATLGLLATQVLSQSQPHSSNTTTRPTTPTTAQTPQYNPHNNESSTLGTPTPVRLQHRRHLHNESHQRSEIKPSPQPLPSTRSRPRKRAREDEEGETLHGNTTTAAPPSPPPPALILSSPSAFYSPNAHLDIQRHRRNHHQHQDQHVQKRPRLLPPQHAQNAHLHPNPYILSGVVSSSPPVPPPPPPPPRQELASSSPVFSSPSSPSPSPPSPSPSSSPTSSLQLITRTTNVSDDDDDDDDDEAAAVMVPGSAMSTRSIISHSFSYCSSPVIPGSASRTGIGRSQMEMDEAGVGEDEEDGEGDEDGGDEGQLLPLPLPAVPYHKYNNHNHNHHQEEAAQKRIQQKQQEETAQDPDSDQEFLHLARSDTPTPSSPPAAKVGRVRGGPSPNGTGEGRIGWRRTRGEFNRRTRGMAGSGGKEARE